MGIIYVGLSLKIDYIKYNQELFIVTISLILWRIQ